MPRSRDHDEPRLPQLLREHLAQVKVPNVKLADRNESPHVQPGKGRRIWFQRIFGGCNFARKRL
jgi:hypothetical protein